MNWFYLDNKGVTTGPVLAYRILTKYHFKSGEISLNTKIWNTARGVKQWTELRHIYSLLADDIVTSIPRGTITKRLLLLMMNPYHVYIYKTKQCIHNPLPCGQAKLFIEYKAYLANTINNENNAKPLQHFIQNRESVILGAKKNPYGLELALYKIREGEQCSVYIPWRLAYGEQGAMNLIPPKTDILFVVTLHKIEKQGTARQHYKVRLDKWSKMRAKWNAHCEKTNTLHVKDIYPIAPQNPVAPITPVSGQQILPINMKKKSMKPTKKPPNAPPKLQEYKSIEDQWKDVDNSPTSHPNTPIDKKTNPWTGANNNVPTKPAVAPKAGRPAKRSGKSGNRAGPKKLHINNIKTTPHQYHPPRAFKLPKPPKTHHKSSKSEGVVMDELAAQYFAQQSAHHSRQLTSTTPTPMSSNEQLRPTLMLSSSIDEEEETSTEIRAQVPLSTALPTQQPAFNNHAQSWDPNNVHLKNEPQRKRTKSSVDWEHWLKSQKIPQDMIRKLIDGGIISQEELNAIEGDIEDVVKELGLSALHKIKLKALLRKMPAQPNIKSDATLQKVEEEKTMNEKKKKAESDAVLAIVVSPEEATHVVVDEKEASNGEEANETKVELENEGDDERYLKAQIVLLKEENLRLKKLADATEMKQQIEAVQITLRVKDVEVKQLQKRLDEESKKAKDAELKCRKLEQLLRLKETQNHLDIQQTLYSNYCESVSTLIQKICCSSSQLDQDALNAMNDIQTTINAGEDLLKKNTKSKQNDLVDSRKNIKELNSLITNARHVLDNDVLLFRMKNTNDLWEERNAVYMALNNNIEQWLSSINAEKAVFEQEVCRIMENKYNEIFYKHFVEQMSMMLYDCKLIRSQFVQSKDERMMLFKEEDKKNKNDSVLCENGEKILFDIPLAMKLLSIVRNEANAKDMFYDVLCLDHLTKNMIVFEDSVMYKDVLRFSCLMANEITNSMVVQNTIKFCKQSGKDMNEIMNQLQQKARQFVDNLMCLIATGYARLIVSVTQKDNNYDWDAGIQCLVGLCLAHPLLPNQQLMNPNAMEDAVRNECLNTILVNVQTDRLKQVLTDYYSNVGKTVFVNEVINTARGHNLE